MSPLFRRLAAELFGTYTLVFAGTGAIVINEVSGGTITHLGIALTFGLVVLAMIYTIGEISGCHINPAVTVALCVAKKFPAKEILPYVVSQCLGAILASLTLRFLFPTAISLGATLPAGSAAQSLILEFLLTLILMVVVLCVTSGSKETAVLAGITIGSVIALEAAFAGPICGASMNPARSLGPALVSMNVASLWIYLTAPTLGAIGGVFVFKAIFPPK